MVEDLVSFDEWQKLDLRVGKIVKVEDIEGADKLYKFTIDLGKEIGQRIICAGIKEYYKKEELKDRKIVVFVNLSPRKLRGIESQGMILAASTEDHEEVILITPEKEIEVGSKIS
ncbi:MAG: methionine--tRNA ligase subunit beta [Nanoarchaeota archaeon]|nr:methionine--tRNA ligase subunit beta [Nanoarchaeota archaeon]MBU1027583.1 methionine--tRNA ligase subunit beta [Nanoarchaeota archaeon]